MKEDNWNGITVRVVGESDPPRGDGAVVILLHGFGAAGDDLIPLYQHLCVDTNVRMVFPAAPLTLSPLWGEARAWWMIDLSRLESERPSGRANDRSDELPDGLDEAHDAVAGVLDRVHASMAPSKVVLGGFSQGAMLAADVALLGEHDLAGLVLLSGTLIARSRWMPRMAARSRIPVFQSHGTEDPLLPMSGAERLRCELEAAGFDVSWHPFEGGHEIPPTVLESLDAFLRRVTADR